MKKIVLFGYMGSGKSAVSEILRQKLNLALADLDQKIEEKANATVSEIFSQKGEIHFRKLESSVLNELLQTNQPIIISLGGGTPCYANNLQNIQNANAVTFFLKTSAENLANRLRVEKAKRPLVANIGDEDLPGYINKHLFERNPFYLQANHIITTDGKSPVEVANQIIACLS